MIVEVRTTGGFLGYAHAGVCEQMVVDDVKADFPELEVDVSLVDNVPTSKERDRWCLGCSEELPALAM